MEQGLDVFHDDPGFVWAVVRLRAADRGGGASVDSELEPQDGVPCAVLIETIPPILDHSTDGGGDGGVNGITNTETLGKLRQIPVGLKEPNVSARNGKGWGRATKGSAVLGKQKKVIIKLVRHGHRNITWLGLGPPYLWWDINHKNRSGTVASRGQRRRR
jgi:hypothetical protein